VHILAVQEEVQVGTQEMEALEAVLLTLMEQQGLEEQQAVDTVQAVHMLIQAVAVAWVF
jgi:hypothetical protein